jgi:hypothetical protein
MLAMAREFDRIAQLRLSQRQLRYLQLTAAEDYGSTSYAPVVRDLIDGAIAAAPPKWRAQLDLADDDFVDVRASFLADHAGSE